jgi:2-C-methyl-D-erythritol 2,4-cyclodiphosphate synthase
VRSAGFALVNVDITIVAEEPKIGPHRQAIRENLARLLDADLGRVSLKAKTTEGLGDIGAGEAMACHAVVLLEEGDQVNR